MFVVQHDSSTDSQWRRCSLQSTVWYVSLATDQRPRCMRSFTPHHHHHHHHHLRHQVILWGSCQASVRLRYDSVMSACVNILVLCQVRHSPLSAWSSGVVVSALAFINEVNLRRVGLVLRWATVSGFNSRCRTLKFRYVTTFKTRTELANSAFHPSGVSKWVPASAGKAGKAKAGMVHSVSGWTRGVQVKLWDLLRTRAIPERYRGVFTTRCYTNPRLPTLHSPSVSK